MEVRLRYVGICLHWIYTARFVFLYFLHLSLTSKFLLLVAVELYGVSALRAAGYYKPRDGVVCLSVSATGSESV